MYWTPHYLVAEGFTVMHGIFMLCTRDNSTDGIEASHPKLQTFRFSACLTRFSLPSLLLPTSQLNCTASTDSLNLNVFKIFIYQSFRKVKTDSLFSSWNSHWIYLKGILVYVQHGLGEQFKNKSNLMCIPCPQYIFLTASSFFTKGNVYPPIKYSTTVLRTTAIAIFWVWRWTSTSKRTSISSVSAIRTPLQSCNAILISSRSVFRPSFGAKSSATAL